MMRAMDDDHILGRLIATGAPYEIVPCDPDLADTAAFCEAYGYQLADSANAIVVAGRADPPPHAVCLVLAVSRLDVNGTVRRRLGTRKASFASAEATVELTGMEIGGVTPFGLCDDLPIWIDAAVMTRERVIVGGGGRDRKFLVAPSALVSLPNAEVVDGLAKDAA